jgi:hypothetical protein
MVFLTHFNAAHEEADGECTHEKLKLSEIALQSRCTMQLESNKRNQTSPANEPWSGSGLDSSLGVLLELLLASPMNVVGGEDGWCACSKRQIVLSESGGDARLKWRQALGGESQREEVLLLTMAK